MSKNRKIQFNKTLKLLSVPLTLLIIYLSMVLIWRLVALPAPVDLVDIVLGYFAKYGFWILFISALLEGVLILGQYYPGGVILFLGVISVRGNILKVAQIIAVVSVALTIAYFINYLLGKYGWYKLFSKFGLKTALDKAQNKFSKYEFRTILLSYWDPNLASITATAAGVLKISLKKFMIYSVFAILVWNILWGILLVSLGEAALKLMQFQYILFIFLIWIIGLIVLEEIKKKKQKKN